MNLKQILLYAALAVSVACTASVQQLHRDKNFTVMHLPDENLDFLVTPTECVYEQQYFEEDAQGRLVPKGFDFFDFGCDGSVELITTYGSFIDGDNELRVQREGKKREKAWYTQSEFTEFQKVDILVQELMKKYNLTERVEEWKKTFSEQEKK